MGNNDNFEELKEESRWRMEVLDHGYVELIDFMGDDNAIEDAARQSYGGGTRKVSDTTNLLRYLMRHKHWSPFEQCIAKFEIQAPIFVLRQLFRYRTASLNEQSARYSVMPDLYYVPAEIGIQSKTNKQGRVESNDVELTLSAQSIIEKYQADAFEAYHEMLEMGVAREQARIVLPVGMYSRCTFTLDLRNIFNLLAQRLHHTAQPEITEYAQCIAMMVEEIAPISYKAFCDYILHAQTYSAQEVKLLRDIISGNVDHSALQDVNIQKALADTYGLTAREVGEFVDSLQPQDDEETEETE